MRRPLRGWHVGLLVLMLPGLWLGARVAAQDVRLSNLRRRWVRTAEGSPGRLDTLFVAPSSVRIVAPAWAADSLRVGLDSADCVRFSSLPPWHEGDSVLVEYRVLPLPYEQTYAVATLRSLRAPTLHQAGSSQGGVSFWEAWRRGASPFTLKGYAAREASLTQQADAPSVGSMNLTLEGAFGNGVSLRGELLSQNMPFQPDGTTVEVRALDRIYLQVASPSWQVEGGDIDAVGRGAFLLYNRPLQGLQLGYIGVAPGDLDSLRLQLAAGVAKGVYTRVHVHPQEGVQGPYRLAGHRGFTQSVILAGSERVFLNGELLARGAERDYTMDYNLGEIRFTARRPMRQRDRIVVEYQVLDRHFMRFLTMGQVAAHYAKGWAIGVRGYVEHDAVSSIRGVRDPAEALRALEALAASEEEAWVVPRTPALDGHAQGGYRLRDTLFEGIAYTCYAYVPRGGADSVYDVPFAYVGAGNGEYALTQMEANMPVYEWVGPRGQRRGEYRAGQRVRPPGSQQVVELNLEGGWRQGRGKSAVTVAYSHRQANSLSRQGQLHGVAVGVSHSEALWSAGSYSLEAGGGMRYASAAFRAVDPFLPADYFRRWGIGEPSALGEWLEAGAWIAQRDAHGMLRARVEGMRLAQAQGWRASLWEQHAWRHVESKHQLSYSHLRRAGVALPFVMASGQWSVLRGAWRFSAFAEGEGALAQRSSWAVDARMYPYWRAGLRAELSDSVRGHAMAEVAFRTEYPQADPKRAHGARQSLESSLQGRLRMPSRGHLAGSVSWRYGLAPERRGWGGERHVLAHLAYVQPAWQDRVLLELAQELGAEQTAAWQQHFIRVPYGQGQYVWVDANGDGVAQVEEFARAQFRDEANYVLQTVPSSEGVLALSHRLQGTVRWSARPRQAPVEAATPWWQRVDAEVGATTGRKRSDRRYAELLIPFRSQSVPGGIEWLDMLRASLTLNREAWPFSLSYGYLRSVGSQLFAQGRDRRGEQEHAITLASPVQYALQATLRAHRGAKYTRYPHRPEGAVSVRQVGAEGALLWRSGGGWQHEWRAGARRMEVLGVRRPLTLQEYSYGLRGAMGKRWHAGVTLRYARLRQAEGAYSPLLYEATQGLLPGSNAVVDLDARWLLSRYVELGASYGLRSLGLSQPIHAASVYARANFQ